ncbi:hypothetical protein C8J57DRAFT_1533616 [Mycena rebaudengoi]|nr:hypothetical protein C8J57DRAFT_1533616 [Mycena rebaudengoi]
MHSHVGRFFLSALIVLLPPASRSLLHPSAHLLCYSRCLSPWPQLPEYLKASSLAGQISASFFKLLPKVPEVWGSGPSFPSLCLGYLSPTLHVGHLTSLGLLTQDKHIFKSLKPQGHSNLHVSRLANPLKTHSYTKDSRLKLPSATTLLPKPVQHCAANLSIREARPPLKSLRSVRNGPIYDHNSRQDRIKRKVQLRKLSDFRSPLPTISCDTYFCMAIHHTHGVHDVRQRRFTGPSPSYPVHDDVTKATLQRRLDKRVRGKRW